MKRISIVTIFIFQFLILNAQSTVQQAQLKIDTLNTLIAQAQNLGIDVLKEQMTVGTAQVFLQYANWDDSHQTENTNSFLQVSRYKSTAAQTAALLPGFERNEIILMLNAAITNNTNLINGKTFRKPSPNLNWALITNDGNQLTFNGRPVFTCDYTWKPDVTELNNFFGNMDGQFINIGQVTSNTGTINSSLMNTLNTKPSGNLGFVFIGNTGPQPWTTTQYGADFGLITGAPFTEYDIDNPGALTLMQFLLKSVVPIAKGKNYSALGYMLCNEPHFYTTKTGSIWDWSSDSVSGYTIAKFKAWLKIKHTSIAELNSLWGTNFANFDLVKIDIPIDVALTGTAIWYDWVTFNDYRVTNWYSSVKSIIKSYDANAKVHLKIMPNLWTDNKRGHGIDMEALTEMSDIIGNDAGSENAPMWGTYAWQQHYAFDWRELYMGYDFYKSISPNKIIFNTEDHFLSTSRSRDLYQNPLYARAVFWAAHTLGLNASQIWFWGRLADGSINNKGGNGYGGSNCQQPRIVNEVASTMMDLNAFSEEITAMQSQRKPIRIFYSETSATNKTAHMDDVFALYEKLNFDGIPLGFATKNIISQQNNSLWDVILVYKTQYVTSDELNSLQTYLNAGGTVVIDAVSLKMDEYGRPLTTLTPGNGTLISATTLDFMRSNALNIVGSKGHMPDITITETNTGGSKGCTWKCLKNATGNDVLSIINLGRTSASLNIKLNGASIGTACQDLINGIPVVTNPTLKPNEVYFVEVTDAKGSYDSISNPIDNNIKLYPNLTDGIINIEFEKIENEVGVKIFNLTGDLVYSKDYKNIQKSTDSIINLSAGVYIVKVSSNDGSKTFRIIKR
ncbi:MAG: T9SS type A sorting domain-containing protein [Bacteroidales bacterium]